ncbi:site-specific integrase [Pseudarthrobacter sp. MDT3-28]|uniref:tyrosine-type recombinase/integrase n=1 Tax=Pseudarthrobacter raffinosi TaxID=2953651 RepID=UPI00208E1254|nr:tyrosine-type recombinase/integrase [Pseudarthrobacter sp. MDT3-28]MCO4239566.1 site-specific integrase [Pseudarthrobacter sp. MDT3-28]
MAHIKTLARANGVAAYEVRWREGNRHRQRTFKVKREAERFAVKVENELEEGNSTAPLVKNSKTFREVAEQCLAADRPRLKQKTLEGYEMTYRVHAYPAFGSRRISTITSQEIEKWVADLRAKPTPGGKARSEGSVRGSFLRVQKIFTYAVQHRLISFSPMTALKKPSLPQNNPNFLTLGQVTALTERLDAFEPYGLIVRFAVWTGLRSGELGALRIRDIDLLHKEVRVERTMSWVKEGWIYTTPKSARSRRAVPLLSDSLIDELTAYLRQHPNRSDADAGLWPGKVKGHPLATYERAFDPKGLYRYSFKPAAKALGMPTLKFHELRHTFASLMVSYGVSMFELSRLMGHGSITVTDGIYAHMYKKDYSELRRRIADAQESTGAASGLWT